MYASSCCSHPSLILKRRVFTSSWSSRVTTASLPAPLMFFLPLSSFAAHFWLRIFSFNSIPNTFRQRASHWTTDHPEMNPSANRRFLSRSQKRVCESATFELAFSHSRRQVDAPFLPHVSCVPRSAASASSLRTCLAFRLGSCSGSRDQRLRWQAASSPWSHAHVQLQRQDDRSQPSEGGEEVAASRPMVWRKSWNWKPTIQNDRAVVFRDLCSVSAYFSACDRP